MNGVMLFCGFFAGFLASAVIFAVLIRWLERVPLCAPPAEPDTAGAAPENKELQRLQRRLAEIDRYNGSEIGGKQ